MKKIAVLMMLALVSTAQTKKDAVDPSAQETEFKIPEMHSPGFITYTPEPATGSLKTQDGAIGTVTTTAITNIQIVDGGRTIATITRDGKFTLADGANQEQAMKLLFQSIEGGNEANLAAVRQESAYLDQCMAGWKRSNDATMAILKPTQKKSGK